MEPLTIRGKELSKLLNISLITLRRMDSAGKVPAPIRLNGCLVWNYQEVKDWVSAGCPIRAKWLAIRAASSSRKS